MRALWADGRRFVTWRRLWLALAEAQQSLGLAITDEQIEALRACVENVDHSAAEDHEQRLRHDVMAHVHALGDQAPVARAIIHLGATSQFLNCNTETLLLRDALVMTAAKVAAIVVSLGDFARRFQSLPTLGYTHYQPAQPTTVGKRATLWAQDFVIVLEDIEHRLDTLRFRGVKGATGTQASFLALFEGDGAKVERLDALVTERMGWPADRRWTVTGQTYPRLVDAQVVSTLACAAAAVHKCATDLRLLANLRELGEPHESSQVGSSAMAYKRNPMRCERATGLARFVMNLAPNSLQTAATQWLERTLDDSSNRRLVLPEAFLALDGSLDLVHDIVSGLVVYEAMIEKNLRAELPFLATENLMMAATSRGEDRQKVHETIRRRSLEATEAIQAGGPNDLVERLRAESCFEGVDLDSVLDPSTFIGRAPEQVSVFLDTIVEPIRARYRDSGVIPAHPRV